MEQAVNTFQKGINKDLNPMTIGNESLTDALNATLLTKNGNEAILQNDMGNRRVDNAYLPSGYTPVGIKEHGGIIYIASYNPITNKSQIGSFPSPERKRGNEYSDLGGEITFEPFQEYYTKENDDPVLKEIKYLKNRQILFPISSDNIIRSGDKFIIYSPELYKYENYISNFFNTKDGKVKSPKNKLYTLSVGVINSQNQFVDITDSLKRFDREGNEIKYTNNESDLYKKNDGYFIANFFEIPQFSETISDSEFIRERQKLGINTYSNKLIGPLYIKISINVPVSVQYEVQTKITPSKEVKIANIVSDNNKGDAYKVEITITSTIKYNCPDFRYNNELIHISRFDKNIIESFDYFKDLKNVIDNDFKEHSTIIPDKLPPNVGPIIPGVTPIIPNIIDSTTTHPVDDLEPNETNTINENQNQYIDPNITPTISDTYPGINPINDLNLNENGDD